MLTASLLLLFQVGPFPGATETSGVLEALEERRDAARTRDTREPEPRHLRGPTDDCLTTLALDPASARSQAEAVARVAEGADRVAALQCLGMAQAELGQLSEAAESFLRARDLAADPTWRGDLGAQRGHALASLDRSAEARAAFAIAMADKLTGQDKAGASSIIADKAALEVETGDKEAARQTLAQARVQLPLDAKLWLLSATLERREGRLDDAQTYIEQAATLAETTPAIQPSIALEAGVIAALAGRAHAARRSFESVAAHPLAGDMAGSARAYLAQLDAIENGG